MVHEAIEYGRAHRIVAQVGAPVLHDTIGGNDDAAMQFVALMDQGLQHCVTSHAARKRLNENRQGGGD